MNKKFRDSYPGSELDGSFEREEAKNIGRELKKRGYDPKAIREEDKKSEKKKQEIRNKIASSRDRQKFRLREAAEYILSVLDEMDYIKESEKKIGDRLKDATNRIHAMNRSAIDKAKDYIKDPKGYDKRQKEKFFKQDQK